MMSPTRAGGATLLELLVALTLIASSAALAARGVMALSRAQASAGQQWQAMAERVDARNGLARDLRFIDLAAPDLPTGAARLAGDAGMLGGARQRAGSPTTGWFGWRVEADRLERLYWEDARGALSGAAPDNRADVLFSIRALRLRYLDAGDQWHAHWPVSVAVDEPSSDLQDPSPQARQGGSQDTEADRATAQQAVLPRAIELQLTFTNGEQALWLLRPGLP
jgi:type II secretory pathway pseudopilin PulG